MCTAHVQCSLYELDSIGTTLLNFILLPIYIFYDFQLIEVFDASN